MVILLLSRELYFEMSLKYIVSFGSIAPYKDALVLEQRHDF
jgi:hypothetical protein